MRTLEEFSISTVVAKSETGFGLRSDPGKVEVYTEAVPC